MRLCVPAVSDVCGLTLVAEVPEEATAELLWPENAARAVSEAANPWLRQALDRVLASGKIEVLPGGVAVVPLVARGRTLGALSLGLSTAGREFDTDTLSMATKLAGRAAIALDNARLYAKMQEQDRRKDEFLAMLAHELRNPLAPISNAVHLLGAYERDAGKLAWAREIIGRQLQQLVRLVDDLLDVARITRGKIELKTESIDVSRVIAAAVETSRPYVAAFEHVLDVSLPSEPLRIKGDLRDRASAGQPDQQRREVYEQGGFIGVAARGHGCRSASGPGTGIPPESLSVIFELSGRSIAP